MKFRARQRLWLLMSGMVLILSGGFASDVRAQRPKKLEIPKPETLTEISNGVTIQYVYYPGGFILGKPEPGKTEPEVTSKPGKEIVPIILLHGFEGRGADYYPLAQNLQRMGHAVVVPDLRGHGSSKYPGIAGREGKTTDKMNRQDFAAMVDDVETVKKFLYKKNNEGQLNLELLCVVGAELGGLVAINWIAADWSRQDLPAFKQGKYAKALVVLSPLSNIKGYSASTAWKHLIFQNGKDMSIMLVSGNRDAKSNNETKQLYNRLEKNHHVDAASDRASQSLWLVEPDTDLSGTKLVDPRTRLNVSQQIAQFITLRLVNRSGEFKWMERKNPLDVQ